MKTPTSAQAMQMVQRQGTQRQDVYELFRQDQQLHGKLYAMKLATHAGHAAHSTASVNWLKLSSAWDSGARPVRERILREFIATNKNKTGPQLERDFGNIQSETRLSFNHVSYLLGHDLTMIFESLNIFLSASSGQRFLLEFMEVGGVLTTLETLGLSKIKETNKEAALRLLLGIAQQGRKYKEFICESYGVRAISDCLLRSTSEKAQDCARNLLYHLGIGNPKFLQQIFKSLLTIITSKMASPSSQQLASQALRLLLPSMEQIPASVIEASTGLLRSVHIHVQYEGYGILRDLLPQTTLQEPIMAQLMSLLTLSGDDNTEDSVQAKQARRNNILQQRRHSNKINAESMVKEELERLTASFVQQAYAAKILGVMAATNEELAEKMVRKQVLGPLMSALSNFKYPDSQRYATNTILFLYKRFPAIGVAISEVMGNQFWETMLSSPDTFSTSLTKDQLKMMRRSTFIVHFDSDESGSVAKTTAEDHSLSELDEEEEEEEMTSSEEEADTSSFKFGDTLKVELQPAERAKSPANKSAQRLDQVLTTEKKKSRINLAEATFVVQKKTEPAPKIHSNAESLYQPMESVVINATLSNTTSTDATAASDDAFAEKLNAIRETATENRTMTKLGMDHRNEADLQLDVKGSAHIGKAVDATGFKRDLGEVMRDEAKDFAEIVKEIAGVDAVEGGATAEEVGDATAGQESQEKTEASPSLPTSEPQSSSDGQQ